MKWLFLLYLVLLEGLLYLHEMEKQVVAFFFQREELDQQHCTNSMAVLLTLSILEIRILLPASYLKLFKC